METILIKDELEKIEKVSGIVLIHSTSWKLF